MEVNRPTFQSYTAKESYHYAVYHNIHRFKEKISVSAFLAYNRSP